MKHCPDCNEDKPTADFYNDARRRDGLSSYCRPCTRARTIAWGKAFPERKRAWATANMDRIAASAKRTRNPEKFRARQRLHNAINRGQLTKPTACQSCGQTTRLDGHHTDYARALDVLWLCRPCHQEAHRYVARHK